jgi:hypothetical protein
LLDAQDFSLNTRTPAAEWWSVQDFGYGTRLTGHTGSGPPYGTGIRPQAFPCFCKEINIAF